MKIDPSTRKSCGKRRLLKRSPVSTSSVPVSTNTGARGGNGAAGERGVDKRQGNPFSEFLELYNKIGKPGDEDGSKSRQLRELLATAPELQFVAETFGNPREDLLRQIAAAPDRAVILGQMDILKARLGWQSAPALEQLLIEQILTTWLRLRHAESLYNRQTVENSINIEEAEYWEQSLSSAHLRHLKAIESLAKVRRLAARAPLVQFNFSEPGSQQLNACGRMGLPEHG